LCSTIFGLTSGQINTIPGLAIEGENLISTKRVALDFTRAFEYKESGFPRMNRWYDEHW
jgi:hypothetical protein